MSRKKVVYICWPGNILSNRGGEDIKRDRIYTVLFVVLTVIKIAAPGVSPMVESCMLKLFGGGEAMEIAATLGHGITGGGHEDAVIASFLP